MKSFAVFCFWLVFSLESFGGAPLNLNGGIETRSGRYAYGWQPVFNAYVHSLDPKYAWRGNGSLRLAQWGAPKNYAGAKQRIYLNQKLARPVRVRGMLKGQNIVDSHSDIYGATLYGEIRLKNGTLVKTRSNFKTKNVGTFDWREIGFNTASLGIREPIVYLDLYVLLGKIAGTAWFDEISVVEFAAEKGKPAVSLVFDDGYKSVKTIVLPELIRAGFRGTVAPFTAAASGNTSTYLNWTDLRELKDRYRWEIASHGLNHRSLPSLSLSLAQKELYDSAVIFYQHKISAYHFFLPFGDYDQATWGLAERFYLSARGVERGDNPYGVLPFDVRIQEIEYDTTTAQISAWLAQAQASQRWLILLFHNVSEQAGPKDIYSVKPALFKQAVGLVKNSRLRVLTYGEAFEEFRFEPK